MEMISYLITVCDEHIELDRLLKSMYLSNEKDEIVVIYDANRVTNEVMDVLTNYVPPTTNTDSTYVNYSYFPYDFRGDFASYKNFGNSKCKNEWIFQIDADEELSEDLMEYLTDILDMNSDDVDLIYVPRINTVKGITLDHIRKWGWRTSKDDMIQDNGIFYKSSEYYQLLKSYGYIIQENEIEDKMNVVYYPIIINFPDYQSRLYRNKESIRWEGKVHEKIVGANIYSKFPTDLGYCLQHHKTIEKQEKQNNLYDTL
jgi:hypothetical protein